MFFRPKRARTRRTGRIIFSLCLVALALALRPAARLFATEDPTAVPEAPPEKPLIYHLKLNRTVNMIMAAYLRRGLDVAQQAGADLVVCELHTDGGSVTASIDMSKMLNASATPTVAWVNTKGASAGATITYACDDIVVGPGATFGSTIVIGIGPEGVSAVGEKYMRLVAQQMRANAEANGHDADLAEAMTDLNVEISYDEYARKMADKGIQLGIPEQYRTEKTSAESASSGVMGGVAGQPPWEEFGKEYIVKEEEILNLNDYEALFLRVAVGRASRIDAPIASATGPAAKVEAITDIPKFSALRGAEVVTLDWSWSENMTYFLTSPIVVVLLLLGAFVGIGTELKVPGFGFPGILGLTCLALLFIGQLGTGAAQWTDLILLVIGIALLGVEIFVIPGFGVVGVLGIICIVVGLLLMLVEKPPEELPPLPGQFLHALLLLSIAIVASGVALVLMYRFVLPHTPFLGALVLTSQQKRNAGYHASEGSRLAEPEKLIGRVGVAKSKLRPAGRAIFDGELYDVVTQGDFINPGAEIEIVEVKSNRIMVREKYQPKEEA